MSKRQSAQQRHNLSGKARRRDADERDRNGRGPHRTTLPNGRLDIQRLLVELCAVDTTPKATVAAMRDAESRCFDILERELRALPFAGARLERRPINPAIEKHPSYSNTRWPARRAYAGRSNLLYVIPGARSGPGLALNAHIDVVAPFFPPRVSNGIVFGRGACDDKGAVVSIVAALKALAGVKLNRTVVAMFVIEEETGGNGSLSLAVDRDRKKLYDNILVGECTGMGIHPANRGAVWYRLRLDPPSGVSALELFAFVNEEMEREGAAIRSESRHPLFPQWPVQTCHGIIGPFGEHPSRICGEVRFAVKLRNPNEPLLRDCLEAGLRRYTGFYGDKTKVIDASTSQPMVARHYDLNPDGEVIVHGATGHMGAIRERDGAITKAAYLIRSLIDSKEKLGPMRVELPGQSKSKPLILEGGQGFVPTHNIGEVTRRLRAAAERGAETYLRRCGSSAKGADIVTMTYNKLHNAAFDGDPDSPPMRDAIAVARRCGFWRNEPVCGWTVSCDARLFATEYPGMPVLTFGPGELARAHSDNEQVKPADVEKAADFLAQFILRRTETAY